MGFTIRKKFEEMYKEICGEFGIEAPAIEIYDKTHGSEYDFGQSFYRRSTKTVHLNLKGSENARYTEATIYVALHELSHHIDMETNGVRFKLTKRGRRRYIYHDDLFAEIVAKLYKRFHVLPYAVKMEYSGVRKYLNKHYGDDIEFQS